MMTFPVYSLKERDEVAAAIVASCSLTPARLVELRRAIERGINCWEDRPAWLVLLVERLPKK